MMDKYTTKMVTDYVAGRLTAGDAHSIEDIKAALNNALAELEETHDGIEWAVERGVHLEWLNEATYKDMLLRWRYSEGDAIFQGEMGKLYAKRMGEMRKQVGEEAHVAASKAIGWGE